MFIPALIRLISYVTIYGVRVSGNAPTWSFNSSTESPLVVPPANGSCWNTFTAKENLLVSVDQCGYNPACCTSFGLQGGCCQEGFSCCKSFGSANLCCGPDKKCCGDSYHTVCCQMSDECLQGEDKKYLCLNDHWQPFLFLGLYWILIIFSYCIYHTCLALRRNINHYQDL